MRFCFLCFFLCYLGFAPYDADEESHDGEGETSKERVRGQTERERERNRVRNSERKERERERRWERKRQKERRERNVATSSWTDPRDSSRDLNGERRPSVTGRKITRRAWWHERLRTPSARVGSRACTAFPSCRLVLHPRLRLAGRLARPLVRSFARSIFGHSIAE